MVACSDLRISVRDDGITACVDRQEYHGPVPAASALSRLVALTPNLSPVDYGTMLFETVFVDPLMQGYAAALEDAKLICRVRLDIDVSQPLLRNLHWESLTAKGPPPRHLGHSYRTPFSRTLPVQAPASAPSLGKDDKIKVLLVVSSPPDLDTSGWRLPRLDEQAALHAVQASLESVRDRIGFELLDGPASISNIRGRLVEGGFHALHVFAHGTSQDDPDAGSMILENTHGAATGVSGEDLAALVSDVPGLRLVVLAGSGGLEAHGHHDAPSAPSNELAKLAPAIVGRGVPAVVAMRGRLDDEEGRLFISTFYSDLVRSKTGMVDQAINIARNRMFHNRRETWAWAAPVLFLSGDGVLFAPWPSGERGAPGSVTHPTPITSAHQTPRPHPTADLIGGKPVLSAGKRIQSAKPLSRDLRFVAPTKEALFDDLTDLDADRALLETLHWLIGNERQMSTIAPLDAEYRELIDTAWRIDAANKLQQRIQRLKETRQKAPPVAQVYDLGAVRATNGFAP